jgi:hypothetical protein
MTTLEAIATIAGAIVLLGGGGVGAFLKHRNGKAKQQPAQQPQPLPPQQVIQSYPQAPPDFDPAADTGQFAVALERAPTETLLQMASDIKTIASTRPATRADLDAVKGEINPAKRRLQSRAPPTRPRLHR